MLKRYIGYWTTSLLHGAFLSASFIKTLPSFLSFVTSFSRVNSKSTPLLSITNSINLYSDFINSFCLIKPNFLLATMFYLVNAKEKIALRCLDASTLQANFTVSWVDGNKTLSTKNTLSK